MSAADRKSGMPSRPRLALWGIGGAILVSVAVLKGVVRTGEAQAAAPSTTTRARTSARAVVSQQGTPHETLHETLHGTQQGTQQGAAHQGGTKPAKSAPARSAAKPATAPPPSAPVPPTTATKPGAKTPTSATDSGKAVVMREVFSYEKDSRRDPFVSLFTTSDLRPALTDLRLVGILYDMSGRRPVAILREIGTANTQYRVTTGQSLGRMRVAAIRPKVVVFTIEEFGFNRQDSLVLGDTTKVKK